MPSPVKHFVSVGATGREQTLSEWQPFEGMSRLHKSLEVMMRKSTMLGGRSQPHIRLEAHTAGSTSRPAREFHSASVRVMIQLQLRFFSKQSRKRTPILSGSSCTRYGVPPVACSKVLTGSSLRSPRRHTSPRLAARLPNLARIIAICLATGKSAHRYWQVF